ncbi:MAG: alpha/beta hydrolase [Clostridia bacterium]|nr:alpha/beta hydrolase [Clostridia bacterium]
MERILKLWNNVPGHENDPRVMEYWPACVKKTEACAVIFPGGGYTHHAEHEGKGYAAYMNSLGMDAFVVYYSLYPNRFPKPLLDARRAVRYIRRYSTDFGVDPGRIAVMGSSAGGHLAALLSAYEEKIEGEDADDIDMISPRPDATILCYPLICSPDTGIGNRRCFEYLTDKEDEYGLLSAEKHVSVNTPPAFIFQTSADSVVDVRNSYAYACGLKRYGIPFELHIFGRGRHGLGTSAEDPYVAQWTGLLRNWLGKKKWLPSR